MHHEQEAHHVPKFDETLRQDCVVVADATPEVMACLLALCVAVLGYAVFRISARRHRTPRRQTDRVVEPAHGLCRRVELLDEPGSATAVARRWG